MARRTLIAIVLSIGFCLSGSATVTSSSTTAHQESRHPTKPRSQFRYAIIWNQIIAGTRYPEGGSVRSRGVDVMLEAKSFSEVNLLQLIKLLSERFPDPEELLVNIYTNLDDVSTPEEAEYVSPPGSVVDLSTPKYAWAFYVRNRDGEHFHYSTNEPGSVVRTVNLRGQAH